MLDDDDDDEKDEGERGAVTASVFPEIIRDVKDGVTVRVLVIGLGVVVVRLLLGWPEEMYDDEEEREPVTAPVLPVEKNELDGLAIGSVSVSVLVLVLIPTTDELVVEYPNWELIGVSEDDAVTAPVLPLEK